MALTLGAALDVIHYVQFHLWPPIVSLYQLCCFADAWVSVYRQVMARFDDGALDLQGSGDDSSSLLVPYAVDTL